MKKLTIAALLGAVLAVPGCKEPIANVDQARLEANQRWNATRARMLCGVVIEHLKVGQVDQAIGKARQALAMDPGSSEARILLGIALIERGDYAIAEQELTATLAQAPESAKAYYLLGVAQEKTGQYAEAIASYGRAYALDRTTLAPVLAAAEVQVAAGQLEEAARELAVHAARIQNDPALFEIAGRVAAMRGQYELAATFYERALDLDGRNPAYRRELGRAQYLIGRFDEALETLQPLCDAAGSEAPAWLLALVGDCCMACDRPAKARDAYEQAVRREPGSAPLRAKLANAYLRAGDVDNAIRSAEEALARDMRCEDGALVLGYALLRSGQADRAVRHLSRSATAHPRNATLLCVLGRARSAGGDEAEAVRCYQAAMEAEPGNALAKVLLEQAGGAGSGGTH